MSLGTSSGAPTKDNDSVNFLLGSFIALDILSCASTRWTPLLEINHAEVLEMLDISLESILGTQNSILQGILEISLLDRWKRESQAAHKLSIVKLARRSEQIEARLLQELAAPDDSSAMASGKHNGEAVANSPPDEISRIFALSAITYLHVVVSGAHPDLPEIASTSSMSHFSSSPFNMSRSLLQHSLGTRWHSRGSMTGHP